MNHSIRDDVEQIELHLLSACLWDDCGVEDASSVVQPGDFGSLRNQIVFGAIIGLHARNQSVKAATVFEQIVGEGRKAELGDNPGLWLADVTMLEQSGFNARNLAQLVRKHSVFRQLRFAANTIAELANEPSHSPVEVLAECEKILFDLTLAGGPREEMFLDSNTIVKESLWRLDERQSRGGRPTGILTGLIGIDVYLGGMKPEHLIVIGARPGCGKTSLALNIADNVSTMNVPVAFFSLEMPASELGDRLLSMRSGVSMHRFTTGEHLSSREIESLTDSVDGPRRMPIYIDDTPNQTAARILTMTRRAIRRYGVKLVIVDYLQLIRPESTRETKAQQVGQIADRLRIMARECKVPVIALAQLNRESESEKRKPRLSDLKESGDIEQAAFEVLLLHRAHAVPIPGTGSTPVDVIVAKNRNGPQGEFSLLFQRKLMKFMDLPEVGEIQS